MTIVLSFSLVVIMGVGFISSSFFLLLFSFLFLKIIVHRMPSLGHVVTVMLALLVVVCLASMKESESTGRKFRPGRNAAAARIYGGSVVNPPFQYPWMVSVARIIDHEDYICGATLIAPSFILTSATCSFFAPS
jgi:hypothetical protein